MAMTRDGKLKVEAITDEFVTLDASTRTDVMAKLDAIVTGAGDMDSTYRRYDGDDNVNAKGGKGRRGVGGRVSQFRSPVTPHSWFFMHLASFAQS